MRSKSRMTALAGRGIEFVNISPLRTDHTDDAQGRMAAGIRPNTDTAMMLGLAHTLVAENAARQGRSSSATRVGFDKFRALSHGRDDGVPKDADWAARICGIDAETIRTLARRMAATRTFITTTWSLQRADHGEQPIWMTVVLAAMLGQIGLPGGGFGFGYGSMNRMGQNRAPVRGARWPQGSIRPKPTSRWRASPTCCCIRARPSTTTASASPSPTSSMVYWCGGNPFHHHQDINRSVRLAEARDRIVHEIFWTPTRASPTSCCPRPRRSSATTSRSSSDTLHVRDAKGDRAGRRGAQRFRHFRGFGRTARLPRGLHRRPRRDGMGATSLRDRRASRRAARHRAAGFRDVLGAGLRRRSGSGKALRHVRAYRADPEGERSRRRPARSRFSPTHGGVRLRRLPRPSGLDRARRMARIAGGRAQAASDLQPAGRAAARPTRQRPGERASKVKGREPVLDQSRGRAERGICATATWCACSTRAAPASPGVRVPMR